MIRTLFLDVGGVMLTNGWDRKARARAADKYRLDHEEMHERHSLTFDTYEEGKLTLDEYLDRTIFYQPRSFSTDEFKQFMFAQSEPLPHMIDLFRRLKVNYGLRMVVVNNEGRELNVYRIEKFCLGEFIDAFVSSCFVHFRKPDADLYRLALDVAHARPEESIYIDDRAMFVDVAHSLGIHGIRHVDYETTRTALADMGLKV